MESDLTRLRFLGGAKARFSQMELVSVSPGEPLLLGGVLHHELLGLALLPLKYDPGVFFGFSVVGVSSRDTNFVFFQPERKQTKSIITALSGAHSTKPHPAELEF